MCVLMCVYLRVWKRREYLIYNPKVLLGKQPIRNWNRISQESSAPTQMYRSRPKESAKQLTVISISTKTNHIQHATWHHFFLSLSPLLLAMWHSSLLVPPFWRDNNIATTLPLKSCSLTDFGTCKEKQPVTGSSNISINLPWWNLYRSRTSTQLFSHSFTVDHATSWNGRHWIVYKPFEQWRIQGVGFRWIDPQILLKFAVPFGLFRILLSSDSSDP